MGVGGREGPRRPWAAPWAASSEDAAARKHTCVLEVCVREDLAPKTTTGRTSAPYPGDSLGRTRAPVTAMAWGGCGPRRDAAQPASRGCPFVQLANQSWVHRGQQTRLGPWDLPLRSRAGRFGSRPCERERGTLQPDSRAAVPMHRALSALARWAAPGTVPCSQGFLCDSAVVNACARVPAPAQARSREAVSKVSVKCAGRAGGRSMSSLEGRESRSSSTTEARHPLPQTPHCPCHDVSAGSPDLRLEAMA